MPRANRRAKTSATHISLHSEEEKEEEEEEDEEEEGEEAASPAARAPPRTAPPRGPAPPCLPPHGAHRLGDRSRDDLEAVAVDDLLVVVWFERLLRVQHHGRLRLCINAVHELLLV